MEIETPESNQEHNKPSDNKCGQPTDDLKNTMKKWVRDPNGWIAICTIVLILIGFCALRISQDTEKRQLRAYIAIDNMQISGTGTLLKVKFNIENFGQTPAKKCSIRGDIAILPFPLPERYVFQIPGAPFKQNSIIPPRATKPATVTVPKVFTKTEITEITKITSKDTHRRIYIFGVLNYNDIFDEPHFTNFCYFLIMSSIPKKDEIGRPIKTFSWASCDQHTDFN